MTRRQVFRLVLLEALLVGGGGTVAGLALGPILGWGIVSVMQRFGAQFLSFGRGSVSLPGILDGHDYIALAIENVYDHVRLCRSAA